MLFFRHRHRPLLQQAGHLPIQLGKHGFALRQFLLNRRQRGLDRRQRGLQLTLGACQLFQFAGFLLLLLLEQLGSIPGYFSRRQRLCLLMFDAGQTFSRLPDDLIGCNRLKPGLLQPRDHASLVRRCRGFLGVQGRDFRFGLRQTSPQRPEFASQQLHFQTTRLLLQGLIGPCLSRLPLQRIELFFYFGDDIADTEQILLGRFKFSQCFGFLFFVPDDSGGFLDEFTPVLRRRIQNLVDLALGNHRMALASRTSVEQ